MVVWGMVIVIVVVVVVVVMKWKCYVEVVYEFNVGEVWFYFFGKDFVEDFYFVWIFFYGFR